MPATIAVYTTRAGQTSTYWATALAWTLAERMRVLLVDCDMEGGTVADLLYLRVDDKTLGNCFGDRPARPDELENQAVSVPSRPNLRVIPGLRSSYGFEISEALKRIEPGLAALPYDVVIADLGHPLAHPGLRSPRTAAEAICRAFGRAFIVIRDDPALVARTINVLRAARPPHGEIIVCHQRSRAMKREIVESIERELPDLPVRSEWEWDERRATRMGDTGVPVSLPGIEQELHLVTARAR
jgi:MinD-like ATPase involved in chromosome partitioning or flagellar assembly